LFDVEGDRPDLIVLIPDTGVLVIDILQHKASAVVKVADGRLTVTDQGETSTISDPLSRADHFAENLASRIRAAGISPVDELPVAAMGVFPYVDADTAQSKMILGVVDADRCLFRDDLDRINNDLTQARHVIAGVMAAPLREVISEPAERLYRAVIHPDTVLTPVQMSLPEVDGIEMDVMALDREQENLAKNLGAGHRVIRGVAGSGKTVILLHRARLLAQLDRRSRILVTCYNRSLHGWLERQLSPYPNVKVRTMAHQLGEVLRMGGAPPAEFGKEPDDDIAARAMAVLDDVGGRARSQLFDHVLIDEAQDFGAATLRFATTLLRDGSESLLVVADAAQSLYRKGFTWKEAGIEASGRRTKVLTRNYRNTREILDYAWFFLSRSASVSSADSSDAETDVIVPPGSGLRHGPLPLFRLAQSPDEEVLNIAKEVGKWLTEGESPGDIAVLYGSKSAGDFPWTDKLRFAFDRAGVPWYWPTDPADQAKHLVGSRNDAVMICTVHSAKGLEFKNVILCGYLNMLPSEEPETNRRLIYVGMTRAKERLVLSASGNHPYIADLERGPVSR